jgi:hypothetical protein
MVALKGIDMSKYAKKNDSGYVAGQSELFWDFPPKDAKISQRSKLVLISVVSLINIKLITGVLRGSVAIISEAQYFSPVILAAFMAFGGG